MSWTELLDRLAGVAGLEPWYYDIKGTKHETTVELKVLVLSALGFDVSSIGSVRASLARLEEEPWRRALSPFGVTPAKSPAVDLFLPAETAQPRPPMAIGIRRRRRRIRRLPPRWVAASRRARCRWTAHRASPPSDRCAGCAAITGSRSQAMTRAQSGAGVRPRHELPAAVARRRGSGFGVWLHISTRYARMPIGASAISAISRTSARRPARRADRRLRSIRSTRSFPIVPKMPARILRRAGCFSIRFTSMSKLNRPHARAGKSTSFRVRCRGFVPGDFVDYTSVWRAKKAALEALFTRFKAQPESARSSPSFVAEQGEALEHFALFSALAEQHGLPWQSWPAGLRRPETAVAQS